MAPAVAAVAVVAAPRAVVAVLLVLLPVLLLQVAVVLAPLRQQPEVAAAVELVQGLVASEILRSR